MTGDGNVQKTGWSQRVFFRFARQPWAEHVFWIGFASMAILFVGLIVGIGVMDGIWGLVLMFFAVGEFVYFFVMILWKVWKDRFSEMDEG